MAFLAVLLVAGATGSCGQSDDESAVRSLVRAFHSALETGDGQAACARLSVAARSQLERQEQRDCRDAVTALALQGGEPARVQVFLTSAKVDLRSGASAFLDRGTQGWRLSAIGCRPEAGKPADRPYECELSA